MPQLDPFTFSSQVFWLITIFLTGYFLFFHFILPNVYTTLKARNRHFVHVYHRVTAYRSKRGHIEKEYRNHLLGLLTLNIALIDNILSSQPSNSSLVTSLEKADLNAHNALIDDTSLLVEYYAVLQNL